jgi:hypothetical protein
MKTYGERRYSTTILDLGTRWRWVVSFTPRPLYSRGKSPRYSFNRKLGGPRSQSGRYGERIFFAPAGNRTPAFQPVARRYTYSCLTKGHCKNCIGIRSFVICTSQLVLLGRLNRRSWYNETWVLIIETRNNYETWFERFLEIYYLETEMEMKK